MQTYDTKPKRRLFDLLVAQGMTANQAVTFITDGGDDARDLPLYLNAEAEHLLDWFPCHHAPYRSGQHGQELAPGTAR